MEPTWLPDGMNGKVAVTGFAVNGSALPMVNGPAGKFVTLASGFSNGASNTVLITEKYSGANGQSRATPWTVASCKTIEQADGAIRTEAEGAAFGSGATLQFSVLPSNANWINGIQGGRPGAIILGMADGTVRTLTQGSFHRHQKLDLASGETT